MQNHCKMCWLQFEITKDDLAFYDNVSPVFNWKKYIFSNPVNCPECRQINRLFFRNRTNIYKRKCDTTWNNIVSMYSSDAVFPVYHISQWYDDNKYNALDYWMEFDFSKWFFEQFSKLKNSTPHPHSAVSWTNENSEYCNWYTNLKNCYLSFNTWESENLFYCNWVDFWKDCMDCLDVSHSELCYECFESTNCYKCKYAQKSKNCSDSSFLYNCIWCKNCFWCVNLRNKEYCFYNDQLSKQEYDQKVTETLNSNWYIHILNQFNEFIATFPKKFANIENSENSIWDNLMNCKDCIYCFDSNEAENCKYCIWMRNDAKDCFDATFFGYHSVWMFNVVSSGHNWYNLKFCFDCWENVSELIYCWECHFSKDCFWCFGLNKHNKYCILNKQYSKEEYEVLVPRIIAHMQKIWEWWQFFPIELSCFAYNETAAQELFPMSKDKIISNNWKWKNIDDQVLNVSKTIPANKLPSKISDIPDDILFWAIQCKSSQKPFKIIPQELKFYRENNIPIPHFHPNERHNARIKLRNPRKLFNQVCDKCKTQIQTTFSSEKWETVYCEECYLANIY